jgi:hypothetical protein
MKSMYLTPRTLWLSFFAATLVAPGALYALPAVDVRKDDKVQTDSTKARKTKTGQTNDDADDAKKKLKPRSVPTGQPAAPNVRPQDDDAGDQPWDTEFLVRTTIPPKSRATTMFVFASY